MICRRSAPHSRSSSRCCDSAVHGAGDPVGSARAAAGRPARYVARRPSRSSAAARAHASLTRSRRAGPPAVELASAYGEMGRLLIAAEYLDAAEPASSMRRRSRRPIALAVLPRPRLPVQDEPGSRRPRSSGRSPCNRDLPRWCGWAMHLDQNRPEAAEPLFTEALRSQPRAAAGAVRTGPRGAGQTGLRAARRHLEQALALEPQASRDPLSAGDGLPRTGRPPEPRAHLRQRGDWRVPPPDPLMLELDGLLRKRGRVRSPRPKALDKREWADGSGIFRKAIELAPDDPRAPQSRHGAVHDRRCRRRPEQFEAAVRLSPKFAKAHYSLGVHHGERPAAGGHRTFLGGREVRPELRGGADAARRRAQAQRPRREVAVSLCGVIRRARHLAGPLRVRDGARPPPAISGRPRPVDQGMNTYPDQPGFAHALARLLAAAPDDRVRDGRAARRLRQRSSGNRRTRWRSPRRWR